MKVCGRRAMHNPIFDGKIGSSGTLCASRDAFKIHHNGGVRLSALSGPDRLVGNALVFAGCSAPKGQHFAAVTRVASFCIFASLIFPVMSNSRHAV